LATVKQWVKERDLSNVELQVGRVADMASEYRTAHVTIAPFINLHHCKPVPNSLLESLASGRPVITTSQVGIADTIQEDKAGQVCQPTGQGIAEALDRIRADWPVFARKARALAVRRFGAERFLHEYERLYSEFVG
jgi:glycosyltransferase involved in cell wall biosynthesis